MYYSLKLKPGPELIYNSFNVGGPITVTNVAHKFLSEHVEFADGVTLNDVFGLFQSCPELRDIFQRSFINEMCDEATLGELPPAGDVEYIRVSSHWSLDTGKNTLYTNALTITGIGHVLTEDKPDDGYKIGDYINWSLSSSQIRELLSVPVRISEEVPVSEGNIDSRKYGNKIATYADISYSLMQVLTAIMEDLSFHGGPATSREFFQSLKAQVDAFDETKLTSFDDFVDEDTTKAISILFVDVGVWTTDEIKDIIMSLDDDMIAQPYFNSSVSKLQLNPKYQSMNGIELRQAYRKAKYGD